MTTKDKVIHGKMNLSAGQLTAVTACFLWSTTGLTAAIGTQAGRALWLCWLLALVAVAPVYMQFPRFVLNNERKKWVSFVYPIYAVLASAVCLSAIIYVWEEWTMTQAPFAIYAALLALLVGYAAARGTVAAMRLSVLLAASLLVLALFDTLLLLPQMELHRIILPIYSSAGKILPTTLLLLLLLLLPLPSLVFVTRRSREEGLPMAQIQRSLRHGFLWGSFYLLLSAVRNVLALGDLLIFDHYPLLRALKMTELGIGLSRLEYFGMMALLAVVASAAMLQLSLAADCLCERKAIPSRKRLALVLCLLLLVSMLIFTAYGTAVDFSGKAVAL